MLEQELMKIKQEANKNKKRRKGTLFYKYTLQHCPTILMPGLSTLLAHLKKHRKYLTRMENEQEASFLCYLHLLLCAVLNC